MKLSDDMHFVKLNREQFNIVVKWAEKEGWNPGLNDADIFWKTDPDGYYGVIKINEIIACGSIVSYNGDFGFMGFFIVKPEFRSKGLGRELWNIRKKLLLARLREGASIGMDGVVSMQSFYAKGGFTNSHRDVRMEGKGKKYNYSESVSPLGENKLAELIAYDKLCFGFDRSVFITNWVKQSNAKTFTYVSKGIFKGFAVIRKAVQGYKIGPLFADDKNTAVELLKACSSAVVDDLFYLDIPLLNREAYELANDFQLKEVFECGRMYFGKPPQVPVEKIFGVTTFELG